MSPNEPKPATPEAQALLRAAGRDRKTVELLLQPLALRARDAPVLAGRRPPIIKKRLRGLCQPRWRRSGRLTTA